MGNPPRSPHRTVLTLLVVGFLLLGAIPGVVSAAESRAGGTVIVAENEVVQGDLQAFAGNVIVYGTVTGDVQAFAGDVKIVGTVNGDVQAFAGSISVTGTVDGNVQGAGGSLSVGESARIGGNLDAGAGSIFIAGTVNGDATVGAETVTLGSTAVVDGTLRYDGQLDQQSGAVVKGTTERDESIGSGFGMSTPRIPSYAGDAYALVVNLLLGAVLLAVFPTFTSTVSKRVRTDPTRNGLVGLATAVGGAVLVVLIAITIIGIPVAILLAIILGLTGWVGSILGQYAVGDFVLRRAGRADRWFALVAGLLGFFIIGFIPVIGGLATTIAGLLGFGAVVATVYERYQGRGAGGTEQTTLTESV